MTLHEYHSRHHANIQCVHHLHLTTARTIELASGTNPDPISLTGDGVGYLDRAFGWLID